MEAKCFYQSPIGVLCIREENGKITNLHIQKEEESAVTAKDNTWQADRLYRYDETGERFSSLLNEACRQLDEYFQGKRRQFDLPLSCSGTAFQQRIWNELQKIPYGETRSYEDIAAAVGNPKAQRAVGQANNRNPIIIMVPCHRVIHKNGDISGYACGIEAKRYLLDLEAGVSGAV
ncbi:MAG: methylated-DNA--[protein]-cysteine S-methyltransferase [Lachnospiraceae bacterium]|nr:methylated-DNA--[protein]-cysteine S-methyltransferase [Lachnospiraceae bacterium]